MSREITSFSVLQTHEATMTTISEREEEERLFFFLDSDENRDLCNIPKDI